LKFGVLLAAGLMLIEASPGIVRVHKELSTSKSYVNSMSDPKWNEVSVHHEKIVVYPNFDLQIGEVTGDTKVWVEKWFDLAKFAVDHDLSTNFGYVPRPLTEYISEQDEKVLSDLLSGILEPRTIYVLSNKSFWEKAAKSNAGSANSFELNGLYVISTID
jgi:hypothetical protein